MPSFLKQLPVMGQSARQKLGHVPRLEALLIDVLLEAARPFMQLKRE
jgi:hypothetical protein